jgi:LPS sulfotransferase NodH
MSETTERESAMRAAEDQPTRFVILSAARTGSTLLRYMLASHPGVFAGGEIFNPVEIKRGIISWCELSHEQARINADEKLMRLRESDPVCFVHELIKTTEAWGYPVIGFKWHYWLPMPEDPAAQHLFADKSLRVIHLKRRNLLRQIVSFERALKTDQWARMPGEAPFELPPIELPIEKAIFDLASLFYAEHDYERCFSGHPMLELYYEDLAQDPQAVGRQALAFLGVNPVAELSVPTEKMGVDSLRFAITNHDELKEKFKAALRRWDSFFED